MQNILSRPLCFVDVETTGSSSYRDRIIEIGIVRVENKKIVKKYNTLLNPDVTLDPFISKMTGITPKDLESAPSFYAVSEKIYELLEDAIFIAHNARFDYSFIKEEFRRLRIPFARKPVCTVKLTRRLYPHLTAHNLDHLIQEFDLKVKKRHRAYDDAKAIYDVFSLSLNRFTQKEIVEAFEMQQKKPSLPPFLKASDIESLPESAGVYTFFGEDGSILYIGKSIDIKDRVASHFQQDIKSTAEMRLSQLVRSIEVKKTGGELGALLLESTLIKKHQPIFNKRLRKAERLILIKKAETKEGFFTFEMSTASGISVDDIDKLSGIFKSLRDAKKFLEEFAKRYELCPKLLGLEKTKTSCFSYQLKRCRGACVGKESKIAYNMRFTEGFSKYRIKTWPFENAIVIEDGHRDPERFIVDKWCLLGRLNEADQLDSNGDIYAFDFDIYKILSRFILSPKNQKRIKHYKLEA